MLREILYGVIFAITPFVFERIGKSDAKGYRVFAFADAYEIDSLCAPLVFVRRTEVTPIVL